MSSTMPAIVIQNFGGPDVLQVRYLPLPVAASGQALVKLAFAGVNFVDLYQRQGRYPGVSLPLALGLEGAGGIVEVARGAVAFDSVGADTFKGSLNALRTGGHMVLFGAASGQPGPVDVLSLMKRSLTLTRPVLSHFLHDAAKLRDRAASVFNILRSGEVQLRVHAQLPLAEAARAHELLASRSTQGKLLLQP